MSEDPRAFRFDIPLVIQHEIGLDPERLSEHRAAQIAGVRGLQLCARLFWAVRQLSLMPQHGCWVYTPEDLYEALEGLGEIGQALAEATSGHVERLEQLVDQARQSGSEARRD